MRSDMKQPVMKRSGNEILLLTSLAFLSSVLLISLKPAIAQDTPATSTASDKTPTQGYSASEGIGSVELGYRWDAGFRGSRDMYRSLVNLDQGVRLLNANLDLSSPHGTNKYFDRFSLRAANWGDPYGTLRLFGEKYGAYRFTLDYRNIDYFNYIPSHANPLLERGILIGQHSFDMTRRLMDFELIFLPNGKISPFIGYSRSAGMGPGLTNLREGENEFMVNTRLDDATDTFRGGLIFTLPRFNLTVEQGVLKFRDSSRIFQDQGTNTGNRTSPLLGQTQVLNQLDENISARGTTPVSRIQLTAFPIKNLTVTGRFIYSRPTFRFDYDRRTAGNFVSFDVLRFFTGDVTSSLGDTERPHTMGNLAFEYHPFSRLSIVDSLYMDKFHTSSSSSLGTALAGTTPISGSSDPGGTFNTTGNAANRLAVNMNQNQLEAIFSLTKNISVRGGHRYVWSDAEITDQVAGDSVMSSLHRNVGLVGFKFKLPKKVEAFMDLESGRSSSVYNRINLLDYTKFRMRGKYQAASFLTFNASISLMDNKNPQADIQYNFRNLGYTFSAALAPANGERFFLSVDYSRADLNSDILYIIPMTFKKDTAYYVDDSHFGGVTFSLALFRGSRIDMGYGIISASGSHPLIYHQPRAALEIPITRRFSWINEWRYYDLNEKLYQYEKFRSNLITSSVRVNF